MNEVVRTAAIVGIIVVLPLNSTVDIGMVAVMVRNLSATLLAVIDLGIVNTILRLFVATFVSV